MSLVIYNLIVRLYFYMIYVASTFSIKAKSWISGRKKVHARLSNFISSAHGKKIWFHCASLGEFEQARPLIEKIRKQHPEYKLVLTFFSPSGYDARRYYEGVDFVGYIPLDTAYDANKFIRKMKPSLVIWVKYEYWYHTLSELKSRNIPVILVSSVFRPGQVFFKWYGSLHREMLSMFTHIFVQNEESRQLLNTINIESEVCKDTRYDSVFNVMSRHKPIEAMSVFKADKKIFIAGSTWAKDADIICDFINDDPFDGQFKYIIAPHDATRENVSYITKKIKKKKAHMSRIKADNAHKFDVAIVDTIGLLSTLYYYGDIAYVGGGFNASVHNILEPAVYGMPVMFGPHYQKSDEAKQLLNQPEWHAAYTVKNYDELLTAAQSLLENDEEYLKIGRIKSREFVLSNTGGTDQIYKYLIESDLIPTAPKIL